MGGINVPDHSSPPYGFFLVEDQASCVPFAGLSPGGSPTHLPPATDQMELACATNMCGVYKGRGLRGQFVTILVALSQTGPSTLSLHEQHGRGPERFSPCCPDQRRRSLL